jgi:hypothetical protein
LLKTLVVLGSFLIGLILLLLLISFIANIRFNRKVDQEVATLFRGYDDETTKIITQEDLVGLPEIVQQWLKYAQVIGKEDIRTVRLRQKAVMRTKPEQPWMETRATQYFTADKPGFIWNAKISFAPLFHLVGRDKYLDGNGHMLIKLMSLIPVADAQGPEINQGTLLRYLVETVCFPTAALNDYITWEERDAKSAKATISYNGITASGVFYFNEQGEVTNFIAKRYMEKNGEYFLETWSTPMKEYKEFNGIRIPSQGEIIWKFESGDFNWFNWEIEAIEYNTPQLY